MRPLSSSLRCERWPPSSRPRRAASEWPSGSPNQPMSPCWPVRHRGAKPRNGPRYRRTCRFRSFTRARKRACAMHVAECFLDRYAGARNDRILSLREVVQFAGFGPFGRADLDDLRRQFVRRAQRHRILAGHRLGAHQRAQRPRIDQHDADVGGVDRLGGVGAGDGVERGLRRSHRDPNRRGSPPGSRRPR